MIKKSTMSHNDKFWEKFGQKVRKHRPEAYSDGDWKAMEQLLEEAARPSGRVNRQLSALVLAALILGYLAGAHFGAPAIPQELGSFPIPMTGAAHNNQERAVEKNNPEINREVAVLSEHGAFDNKAAASGRPVQQKNTSELDKGRGGRTLPVSGAVASGPENVPMPAAALPEEHIASRAVAIPAPSREPEPEGSGSPINAHPETGMPPLSAIPSIPGLAITNDETIRYSATAPKTGSKFYVGFLLGSNLSVISIQDAGYSLYPFGGVFAGLRLHPRWAVQAEAHVKYVDNLRITQEQTAKLESNNGYVFDQVSIRAFDKNYLALEMPLEAKYRLSSSWSLSAGVRPAFIQDSGSFLFGGNEQEGALLGPTAGLGQDRAAGNRRPELRKFDIGATVALEWAFHHSWSLNLRYAHGLLDLTPVQVFKVSEKHYNTGVQLSIRREF